MKKIILIIISCCYLSLSLLGYNEISNDFTKPTEITINENCKYELFEFSKQSPNDMSLPEFTREYPGESYYLDIEIKEHNKAMLRVAFEKEVMFGTAFYLERDGKYKEIVWDVFRGEQGKISISDNEKYKLQNYNLIARIWLIEDAGVEEMIACVTPEVIEGSFAKSTMGVITELYSPLQLVEHAFVQEGENISNLTYTGHPEAIGYFWNAEALDFEEGVILSTGRAVDAIGPNVSQSGASTNLQQPGDPDLSNLISGVTHDAAVIEFDFVPHTETVEFEYVFASDEYHQYVMSSFNDVFAFFISGGPEEYELENIALIPGTSTPVSINNVNSGNPPGTDCVNCEYFIDNVGSPHIMYDGMTVALTASADVTANETYHMKLAIADVSDGIIDSAVFLKKRSFSTTHKASGKVYVDENSNCIFDEGEITVPGNLIHIEPLNAYVMTDESGKYEVPLLIPETITLSPVIMPLWDLTCPGSGEHQVTNQTYDTLDFAYEAQYACPLLHVNIVTYAIRPCFTNIFSVSYSNQGTEMAENVFIEVEFGENLTTDSAQIPFEYLGNNIYSFDIGTLDIFESGQFNIYVDVTCDLNLLGHTRCATAYIFADNTCDFYNPGVPQNPPGPAGMDPEWDQSSISVTGLCENDLEACFTITNNGEPGVGDMDTPNEYRIFENDTLVYTGEFQLAGGESIEICHETLGLAIHLNADQSPGHPGFSNPHVIIEDCGDVFGTSLGYITTNPYNDGNFDVSTFCKELTMSYDPNDKHVYPSGVTENNYISNDAVLNYLINFQNTGNDTAFLVIIKDTLSPYLDVSTIQNGASSHPHTFEVSGQGILTWTFNNIMLPDSTTNEPESKGFVSFSIHQKPLIAPDEYGTVISNKAEIYFDFNEPIVTNQVDLIFWELPLIITHKPDFVRSDYKINVYPNPANSEVTVRVKNYEADHPLEFKLYDMNGKVVRNMKNINKDEFSVSFDLLPSGIYIYRISGGNKTLGEGKLVLE